MEDRTLFPYKDIDGNDIYDCDEVLYNDNTYIIMNVNKDNTGWILHPCGNNQTDTVNVATIPVIEDVDNRIPLKVIK